MGILAGVSGSGMITPRSGPYEVVMIWVVQAEAPEA